ncbi:rho guanine nucleotide exchange factor 15 [Brienomyrus brachyistius]|uniref:rho guanine nucleotide exchange factor 15 n=1 Tax=Brienomyrus brachyistius TaxID=42636 RepID=UPI0020B3873A|nr:rho guanine nucleotide exchange factor 15 [Brienomyrus brachyistius]XP_048883664.1 rho guanine nucleotide exchange factor 15 [Brienomyrus brachyistius]XP_048883665.1 rho guanine nucleotide exchange factor 15 [Brienomyrus brachyistius]XP_048883666.1 rho guanine nucleotide exchange factor 15 [Brienomyrus brachyistius]XP_048883667.1 rho guanine nucleotide exchange factor 15 [Brienomyrus brachyistius]
MSVPEPPIQSQDSVCQIPDRKPRPIILKKPDPESVPPTQTPQKISKVATSGNVKNIVSKFNRQHTLENEHPTQGGMGPPRKPKRVSTVRPKPRERGRSARASQTPPLPARRSRFFQKSSSEAQVETEVTETPAEQDKGRPAPEGKEVETPVAGTVPEDVEPSLEMPSSPACSKDCSCICHLKRPGMRLVWILEGEDEEEEDEEEDEEEEDEEDNEGEEVEEVESEYEEIILEMGVSDGKQEDGEEGAASEAEEKMSWSQILEKASKQKFSHTLDYVIKRKSISGASEPGVQEPLCVSIPSLTVPEEDNIYEDVLEPIHVQPKVNHPGAHCPDPKFHPEPLEAGKDPVPAIPPRVPLVHDKASKPRPVPGGILLPQLFPDDRRNLRPVSPMDRSQSGSQALRPQAQTSPLLPPRRFKEPAPRSSPDGSSFSSQSAQSVTQLDNKEERPEEEEVDGKQEWSKLALSRKMSEDWNSQLQDEPLYQTYRATVITKEIRRQTVCRNISKTTADYVMEWGVHSNDCVAAKGGTGQNTLWQNLPGVKSSGILNTLTKAECKHQESMFEVLTSEVSYLRSLQVLTDHFLESRDLDETLIIHDKKTLFSNILRVREVSERFLKDLEDRMNESLVISDICDIIHYHAQHNFPAYIDYVRNQIYQEKTYSTLMQTNAQFAAIVHRLQELPQCQRLPLMSFLLLPFQRITRLKMLIENIVKRTKEGTKEELSASKALNSVSKIIEACNTEVGKMKQVEELIHVSKMLEFEKIKAIPIISQNRFLEKSGELQEMAKGNTLFSLRPKFTPISLFLFNDLLIIANKKSSERHVVMDHAHRSLVQVQPVTESSAGLILENCFLLTLLENHQGRMYERLFKAPSQSDMHRWLAAFPDPENMERETNEVVYKDWDCPQVHCIEQHVAQQSDELNLEPTDIINVLRKTNEGWYQGIRLSDGQKGWFPASCVQEITNEHVRRRNLRERFRLIQAADVMTRARTGP